METFIISSDSFEYDERKTEQLYTKIFRLNQYLASLVFQQLTEWPLTAPSLPGRIEQLWIHMYEHGYFALEDVVLCQAWLQALVAAGYKFPPITRHPALRKWASSEPAQPQPEPQ